MWYFATSGSFFRLSSRIQTIFWTPSRQSHMVSMMDFVLSSFFTALDLEHRYLLLDIDCFRVIEVHFHHINRMWCFGQWIRETSFTRGSCLSRFAWQFTTHALFIVRNTFEKCTQFVSSKCCTISSENVYIRGVKISPWIWNGNLWHGWNWFSTSIVRLRYLGLAPNNESLLMMNIGFNFATNFHVIFSGLNISHGYRLLSGNWSPNSINSVDFV